MSAAPWTHQTEAHAKAILQKGFLLAHDMGTGKSRTAVMIAETKKARSILIMCPHSVVQVWPNQFRQWGTVPYMMLPLDSGGVKKKAGQTQKFLKLCQANRYPHVVIVNHESAWRPPLGPDYHDKRPNVMINKGLLLSEKWDMVIIDESHRIKSPSSQVSWFCKRLSWQAGYRLALTGTPMPNNFLDAYGQYRFINPKIFGTSFSMFRSKYAIMGGYENRQCFGIKPEHEAEFQKRFFSAAHRVMADDVIDLPDYMDEVREATLAPKTMKIYRDLEKQLIAQVGNDAISVNNALVKILRLAQMTSGLVKLDNGQEVILDTAKADILKDLLMDIGHGVPVAIFCWFRHELDLAMKVAKLLGRTPVELSGEHKPATDWKNGIWSAKNSDTIVVQIQAGGTGVDLTATRYGIYFSTSHRGGDYDQSRARIRRPGSDVTKKICYYHIHAKGTIDKRIYSVLGKKGDAVRNLLETYKQQPAGGGKVP